MLEWSFGGPVFTSNFTLMVFAGLDPVSRECDVQLRDTHYKDLDEWRIFPAISLKQNIGNCSLKRYDYLVRRIDL